MINISLAKNEKSPLWTKAQLIKVLKSLKKGKARDPWGLSNEIFKPDVAGSDLILALLTLSHSAIYRAEDPMSPDLAPTCTNCELPSINLIILLWEMS